MYKNFNLIGTVPIIILCFAFYALPAYSFSVKEANQALEEWDIGQAQKIAQELMAKNPSSPEVAFTTGKVYFYMGEYFKALTFLEKAVKEKNLPEWMDFYNFVKKVNDYTAGYIKRETDNFEIRFFLEDEVLVRYLETKVPRFYKDLTGDFGVLPKEKIIIEIFPTLESFNHCSSLSKRDIEASGAIGIAKFNRIMVLSPRELAFGYRWPDTIAHEYSHYLTAVLTRGNFPLWLHEGLAYYGGKGASRRTEHVRYNSRDWDLLSEPAIDLLDLYQKDRLSRAVMGKQLIKFRDMEPSLVKLKNQEEVSLAFAQVATAASYLIKKYGRRKLNEFMTQCGLIKDYKKAFKTVYLKSIEDFEEEWAGWLALQNIPMTHGLIHTGVKLKEGNQASFDEAMISGAVKGNISLADEFFINQKYDAAEGKYRQALLMSPRNPVILNKLGRVLSAQEKHKAAADILEEAVKYNPDYSNTYVNLADAYLKLGQVDDAMEALSESNEINPFNPYIHKMMGLVYFNRNDRANAIFEWRNVLKLDPGNEEMKRWLRGMGLDIK